MLAAIIGLAGCAGHYYRTEGDTLHLYVTLPEARSVFFASSLDDFELHAARRVRRGAWEISLPAQREFKYFYVADGKVFLPECRLREADDFGSADCIFVPGM